MSNQWLPAEDTEDTSTSDDSVKDSVTQISDLLDRLEESVNEQYQDDTDNPTLISQLQAVRLIRVNLNDAFPYPDEDENQESTAGYPIGSTLPDDEGKVEIATAEERFPSESVLPDDSEDESSEEVATLEAHSDQTQVITEGDEK